MDVNSSVENEARLAAIEGALLILFATHPNKDALKKMLKELPETLTVPPDLAPHREEIMMRVREKTSEWADWMDVLQHESDDDHDLV